MNDNIDPAVQALIDQIAVLSYDRAGLIGQVARHQQEAEALRAELVRLQGELAKSEGE